VGKQEMSDAERQAFAEKVRSLSFSTGAANSNVERTMSRDMDAYKRMRREGLQPPRVTGSADLESRAETKMEVEAGQIVRSDAARKATESLLAEAKG